MSTLFRTLMLCGACLCAVMWAHVAVAAAPSASLALASKPTGCQFQIIDAKGQIKAQGKTPYVGVLPAGRYMLKVNKAGFFTEQRGIVLSGGQQRILQVVLTASGQSAAPTPPKGPATPPAKRAAPKTTPNAAPAVRKAPAARTTAPDRRAAPDTRTTTPAARTAPTDRVVPADRVAPTSRPAASVTPRQAPAARAPAPRQTDGGKPSSRAPAARVAPEPRAATGATAKRVVPARAVPQRASPNATTIDPPGKRKKAAKKKKGRSIPWIPLVAAGGLAIAGGVFWGLSGGSLAAAQDRSKFQRDAFQEYQQGRTHRSTAIFLFAAGGAALGLAALFYFWNPSKRKKKTPPPDNSTPVGQAPAHSIIHHPPTTARFLMESSTP